MVEFKVGDRVVCVDPDTTPFLKEAKRTSQVLKVCGVSVHPEDPEDQLVGFEEYVNGSPCFFSRRFQMAPEPAESATKPSYYHITIKGVQFDAIDLWNALDLTPCVATALKYLVRAGRKTPDRVLDLEKAIEFLNREVARLKAGGGQ